MAKGFKTRTTQQVLSDQEKDALKAQANREAQTDENSAVEAGNGNMSVAIHSDNREVNAMVTRAKTFGEKIDSDEGYQSDAEEIMQAQEVTDYKVITMLKHIDNALSSDERMLLPWPGSTKAEAENKKNKVGDNGSAWGFYMSGQVLFDKPKASGGRAEMEMFYANMLASTTLGKQVLSDIGRIAKEKDTAKVDTANARLPENILADEKRYNSRYNKLLSALRTAAQLRIMLEDIKERCPYVVVSWIRETMTDEQAEQLVNSDLSYLNVAKASNVVHSPSVFNVYTKPVNPQFLADAMKKSKQISIGSFKRWKIDKAIELAAANKRRVTYDDMVESAKGAPPAPRTTPPAAAMNDAEQAKRWIMRDVVDVKRSWEGFMTWYYGDGSPLDKQAKHTQLMHGVNASEDFFKDVVFMYDLFRPVVETNEVKANAARKQLSDKAA